MIRLERQSPSAAHWAQHEYDNLFSPETLYARFAWVVEEDTSQEPSSDADSKILGFLIAQQIDREWELENIVVGEISRRKGRAKMLLSELVSFVQSHQGLCIFLEVRESNRAARALYEKLGFKTQGGRKSYYTNPQEGAILYRLDFG